jgi:hypothetical protein
MIRHRHKWHNRFYLCSCYANVLTNRFWLIGLCIAWMDLASGHCVYIYIIVAKDKKCELSTSITPKLVHIHLLDVQFKWRLALNNYMDTHVAFSTPHTCYMHVVTWCNSIVRGNIHLCVIDNFVLVCEKCQMLHCENSRHSQPCRQRINQYSCHSISTQLILHVYVYQYKLCLHVNVQVKLKCVKWTPLTFLLSHPMASSHIISISMQFVTIAFHLDTWYCLSWFYWQVTFTCTSMCSIIMTMQ